jgi:hypothetical protein
MESLPPDIIEQTFEQFKGSQDEQALKLFDEGDIDLKTDLSSKEVVLVTALDIESKLINKSFSKFGFDFDLYGAFLQSYKRHKVSLDRKSRSEFVASIMKNTIDRDLNRVSNLKNVTDSRQ